MDQTTFFYVATALSLVYALAVRLLQSRLMDKKLMQDVQDKTKRLNELAKESSKGDKRKTEEMNKLNEEMMPAMNKMMFMQMKSMVVILALFFAFTWVVGYMDPTTKDDFPINLTESGNGTFSGSFAIPDSAPNFWYITAHAMANSSEIGSNQSVLYVGQKTEQIVWIKNSGSPLQVGTDKEVYAPGESVQVEVHAPPGTTAVSLVPNMGTRIYVDLPFTIPLLNLRRIYDSQSWFIFSAFIIGLLASPVISRLEKMGQKEAAKKT